MSRIKNILFGKIAVSTKFITDEQLDECLNEQIELEQRGERVPRLGELLESKGYLTKRQIRSLLETMQSMQRRLFGEIATSFQFVTLDQVQTCLELQRHLQEPQESVPLLGQSLTAYREYAARMQSGEPCPKVGEIMIAMGFLKEHQVKAVLEEQNKRIVECENCEASLNVTNFKVGQKVKCGQCQTVLVLAQGETGDLEAIVPRETHEQPLPAAESKVESFAESEEPLLTDAAEEAAAKEQVERELLGEDTADSDLRLVKPTVMGDFRVISKIGQDSTGTLYKAEQVSKHRLVVMKLMNNSTMQDAEFAQRFVSEAKKVAGLDHKSIKRIFSLGKIGDRYFVAQEFVDGESVHKLLEREQRVPYTRALEIAIQTAEALEYAHKRGVMHHDLRPSNLMILGTGAVKVAQLGLASKSTENILTISKSGALAPFYIAPEIVTEDRDLDHRTDIYSLGAILFHMITGRPPYQGSSPFEILVRLTEETIPPLKFFDPSIPDPLCAVVERMLQAEPEERYQSWSELLSDMRSVHGLADSFAGDVPNDMEPVVVKSKRFTPVAMPSPEGTQAPPRKSSLNREDETVAVDERNLRAAKQAAEREVAQHMKEDQRARATVKSLDPKMALVALAVVALSVGGWYLFGGKDVGVPTNGGPVKTSSGESLEALNQAVAAAGEDYALVIKCCQDYLAANPGKHEAEVNALLAKGQAGAKAAVDRQVAQVRTEIGDLIASGGYVAAYMRWDELTGPLAEAEHAELRAAQKADTHKFILTALTNQCAAQHAVAEKGEFDTARQALEALKAQATQIPDADALFDREIAAIEELRKQAADAAAAQAAEEKSKKAQELCAQLSRTLQTASRTLVLADFQAKLAQVADDAVTGTPYEERLTELKWHGDALLQFSQRLSQKVGDHLRGLTDNANYARNPVLEVELDGKILNAKVINASEAGLDLLPEDVNQPRPVAWANLPAKSLCKLAAELATTPSSAAEHVQLGLYALYREVYREAERAFNRAVQLGEPRKNLERYFANLTETFNKQAAVLLKDSAAASAAGEVDKGIALALELKNEYGDTEFARKNADKIAAAVDQACAAIAGKGKILGFLTAQELSRFKLGGDGKWTVKDGLLQADSGKQIKLDGDDKNIEELSLLFRVSQDDATKLVARVGEYKLSLEVGKGRANGSKGTTLKNGTVALDVVDWHIVRMRRTLDGTVEWFQILIDGVVVHQFKDAGNRDGFGLEVTNRKSGILELDNLIVR